MFIIQLICVAKEYVSQCRFNEDIYSSCWSEALLLVILSVVSKKIGDLSIIL